MATPDIEIPYSDRVDYEKEWNEHLVTVRAYDGHDQVGSASGYLPKAGDEYPYLEEVTVTQNRKGVGSRLIRAVGESFKEKGYEYMEADVISEGGMRVLGSAYGPDNIEILNEPMSLEEATDRLAGGEPGGAWVLVRL